MRLAPATDRVLMDCESSRYSGMASYTSCFLDSARILFSSRTR